MHDCPFKPSLPQTDFKGWDHEHLELEETDSGSTTASLTRETA
jgi:hypothetical protein